jgi:protein phosphatase 2C
MVMASAGVNNMPAGPSAGAEGSDPAAECRLRRRRRLALLRHVTSTSAGSDESAAVAAAAGSEEKVQTTTPTSESSEEEPEGASAAAAAAAINVASATTSLPSDAGTAAAVWPVAFGSVALAGRLREMEDTVSLHPSFCVWADGSPMHFFAVFDGHGGPHVRHPSRHRIASPRFEQYSMNEIAENISASYNISAQFNPQFHTSIRSIFAA